ncbi:VIT family protein [Ramlibacter aquaticus]|uniref:VIT family protein n=1 Tax=Ramlibacter aquaticus TaxID=2780094 RepID=A0ABR9SCQ8_9BURK|nr:VIT family protein [Ramlibacter aquaticus]MBE7940138.1 VIT family protein [Ramlibacter aquaticus]
MTSRKKENHKINRIGWLRATVLGANDGIISTSSIMLGIAAAHPDRASVLLAGVAALAAGAMSMAAGEYVSVSSQADTEKAALNEEKAELASDAEGEHRELAAIYVRRGVQLPLARQVASQLMAKDALAAHARDELGINEITSAQPLLAAVSSALSFSSGALLPLVAGLLCADGYRTVTIVGFSLASLAVLGAVAARIGGAPVAPGVIRILFWSSIAMGVTMAVGHAFGAA